jgi:hypothetical protein
MLRSLGSFAAHGSGQCPLLHCLLLSFSLFIHPSMCDVSKPPCWLPPHTIALASNSFAPIGAKKKQKTGEKQKKALAEGEIREKQER